MITREEKILEQIELQNRIVLLANINLVTCGNCGSVMFHEVVVITQDMEEEEYEIECPYCDFKSEPCDFPDFFYDGMDLSVFQEEVVEKAELVADNHTKVLRVVMERYEGLSTLKLAMWEDEDVVLVNLADDLNDELSEEEILVIIRNLLK